VQDSNKITGANVTYRASAGKFINKKESTRTAREQLRRKFPHALLNKNGKCRLFTEAVSGRKSVCISLLICMPIINCFRISKL
jgi:hypothetical protein